jgi:hypothetical protein
MNTLLDNEEEYGFFCILDDENQIRYTNTYYPILSRKYDEYKIKKDYEYTSLKDLIHKVNDSSNNLPVIGLNETIQKDQYRKIPNNEKPITRLHNQNAHFVDGNEYTKKSYLRILDEQRCKQDSVPKKYFMKKINILSFISRIIQKLFYKFKPKKL